MMRAKIREEPRITMTRFYCGLNLEVRDRADIFMYHDLNDLVQLCVRVEQHIRKRSTTRREVYSSKFKSDKPQEEKKRRERGKKKDNYRESSSKEAKIKNI